MLGKLFKYEFRHTAKTMFLTYAALGLFTLMASAALYRMNRGLDSDKTFFTVLSTTMLILYIIAIIAIYCVDFIYLIYQYYKTMYSAQGYLTHTLPVSPTAVFSVKILAMFVWMFFSSMLSVLSVLILLQIGSGGEFSHAFSDIVWSSFTQGVNDIFGNRHAKACPFRLLDPGIVSFPALWKLFSVSCCTFSGSPPAWQSGSLRRKTAPRAVFSPALPSI